MKTIEFLFAISLSMLINCQKSESTSNEPDPVPPVIELGKVAMDRDGQPWTSNFTTRYYYFPETVSFGFSAKTTLSNGVEETMRIADIPCKSGIYSVEKGLNWTWGNSVPKANISWLLDGDQSLGGVSADSTHYEDNFVEVIRYDSVQDIVEGRFQIYLKNHWVSSPPFGLPDSVRLTNGRFHLKIEE